jgi:hypothetical protein
MESTHSPYQESGLDGASCAVCATRDALNVVGRTSSKLTAGPESSARHERMSSAWDVIRMTPFAVAEHEMSSVRIRRGGALIIEQMRLCLCRVLAVKPCPTAACVYACSHGSKGYVPV